MPDLALGLTGATGIEPATSGFGDQLLGLLFVALALGFALVAVYAALEGGSAWVIALAAAALALWIGDLARRALSRRRA